MIDLLSLRYRAQHASPGYGPVITSEELTALLDEVEQAKSLLRSLVNASNNVLTGISLHNERKRNEAPIDGPVIKEFREAYHNARLALMEMTP